jgi:chemotaxis protein MotB
MPRPRRKSEDHGGGGGHDGGGMLRWLLTYADMITLLMAFFILMYSMSILNLEKFKAVAISIRSGLGGELDGGKHLLTHPSGQRAVTEQMIREETKSTAQVAQELREYIKVNNLQQSMRVNIEQRGLVITIVADNMLFQIGSADLQPSAQKILTPIAKLVGGITNDVLVEGHSCDLPIHTERFPSNWELSSARASRVIRTLIEQYKVPANRLAAAGYADTRPTAPNDSEDHRRWNRRVDVVVLTTSPAG